MAPSADKITRHNSGSSPLTRTKAIKQKEHMFKLSSGPLFLNGRLAFPVVWWKVPWSCCQDKIQSVCHTFSYLHANWICSSMSCSPFRSEETEEGEEERDFKMECGMWVELRLSLKDVLERGAFHTKYKPVSIGNSCLTSWNIFPFQSSHHFSFFPPSNCCLIFSAEILGKHCSKSFFWVQI